MSATKLFKKIVRPFYNLLSQKLFNDLRVQEIQDLLLQINHRVFTVEQELQNLKSIQSESNVILSGIDSRKNPLYSSYEEAALEVHDLAELINGQTKESVEMATFFEKVNVDLRGKKIVIIGGNQLLVHVAKKRGVKKVIQIIASSQSSTSRNSEENRFVYPLDLFKIPPMTCDLLFIIDASWTTLLISRGLAHLAGHIKEAAIIVSRAIASTAFNSSIEPSILSDSGRISLNDNYLRQELHENGFLEVHCKHTSGTQIDNKFDIKVSKFNQLNGMTIIEKNKQHSKDKKYNNKETVEKIYIAYKLPTKKYIS